MLWQFIPGSQDSIQLLAADAPGGVSVLDWTDAPGSSDAQLLAVDGLDTSGAATENPVSSTIATAAYFDDNNLMAVNDANQVLLAQGTGARLGQLTPWAVAGGGPAPNRGSTILTKNVTVVGWVDKNQISFPPTSTVSVPTLLSFSNPVFCGASVLALTQGDKLFISTDTDRQWTNAFLLFFSANPRPGGNGNAIDPAQVASGGDYRLFNHFQARLWTAGSQIVQQRYVGWGLEIMR